MAVTGTYRKVGDAFILTSDLVGMGTRKLKLANYDSELDAKVHNQENVWREQIYKSGRLSQIRYRSDDRLTPGDALMKKLDQGFPGNEAKITATDLTGELRDFVQRQNEIYRTQQVTAEGATAQTEYEYSFVLPNGDSTKSDIDTLGEHIFFASATSEPVSRPQQTSMPKVDLGTIKDPTALCITANTQAEAQHAIDVASLFGFKDVWLDTLSPKVLTVAVKLAASRSIKLSLAVRPFDYRTTTDSASADRTILGDTPPESMKRRMADITWEGISSNGWKSPELLGPISPLSNGYIARQETVANLAKTPGLAGVHILNPTPRGYNGPRVDYMSFPQPLFLEKGNFGYAPDLRLAFIRERNVDPIDLVPPQLYSNSDLRQPFFLDDALRGSSSIYDGSDQPNPATATMMREFDTWLAKLNHRSLQSLLDAISTASPGTAITMEAIPVAMNAVNRVGGGLVDWKPGDTLPEFTELRRGDAAPDLSNYVQRIWVSDTVQVYAHAVLTYMARPDEKRPRMAGIVLDLTNLEPLDADKWLGQTLVRQADKGR